MALQHLRASVANKRPAPSGMSDGQLAINTNDVSPGLFFKNAGGALVKIGPVHVGTTAPNATPASGGTSGNTTGELWLDSTGGDYALKTWDGSAWRTTVVTSGMIKDGTIGNADINDSAGIVYSKLALSSGIVNADISGSAAIALSKIASGTLPTSITVASANLVDGTIVNDDINATAAIAGTKISPNFGSQDIITTGSLQGTSFNGGALAGMRNRIINGNFAVWQRGTSFNVTANNTFTADRWVCVFDGTGATRTISLQAFSPGQSVEPAGSAIFLRYNQSVAGSGGTFNNFEQRIEFVGIFEGTTVTISFWAKAAANTTVGVTLAQGFGTGGSPSASVFTSAGSDTITTSWTRYSYTVAVPSISGKTIGTNGDSFLSIIFTLPQNATFTFDVAQVQLEPGAVATPFERRPYGQELALCQRYYHANLNAPTASQFSGDVTSGNAYQAVATFPTTMRAVPTVTLTHFLSALFDATPGNVATSIHGLQEQRTAIGTGRGAFLSSYTASAEL